MAKFRKKPVEIEAIRFEGVYAGEPCFEQPSSETPWLDEGFAKPEFTDGSVKVEGDGLRISTLEGDHRASPGDWIIRGVKGELYPCKPDIFDATYEAVA